MGAGPAGIYAADILDKSDADVTIDLFERMPAPFGLIRYGVAPDHPRIKGIVTALEKVLAKPNIRLLGNIDYGTDIKLDELREFYDAVIFSTGASADRALGIPGIDLDGSFGAADFVSWYDGHPDVPRTWPLTASSVAVLGVGNVALDVARVLAKTADELLTTDIPENVYQGLKASPVTDVHVFGRRGPAQAKFTPLELRELDHSPNVEVIVYPEDIEFDDGSIAALRASKQIDMVVKTLQEWAIREPGSRPRRLHLHFFHSPAEVLGEDGRVTGLRTERTELTGDGNVRGTGEFHEWDVQAVYRAVGYLSSHLPELPFDHVAGVVPNQAGRVLDLDENQLSGVYVTGWIKRGPIGLIGHTKGDAAETIASLLTDADTLAAPKFASPDAILDFLEARGIPFTNWDGWGRLDAHEKALGSAAGRDRVKVVEREEMTRISRG
ncbi:ferredoxin--NADP+ reductase [Amycolatopsis mediterranei S699]|uniref:ferredoxin--NADP(+) reductase n=2 Tax=Amycolatopsis mediterranei TaxID=33910 RepID=A0A0H3CV18_AMYMU|nr:FAD-dependent oxidoreductase [Amycolatopsis mediterranei]ADJ41870.1 ferredoxin--NADP+ reductase [Amycolatopsis mediterranei U32]AEK38541.1 ferredoxin--NADP+ reductase [Amycolatopsis mediterranei S699]AFO73579.1 ferredoxin--NADP+ reductase [Amycolatopsis mediterranei S699]AGT80708.1 ferredoxin--NADP+ reductase [Amycolatopsis mediterranei RB]KDO09016.1 pyridine nucleotide-disulfide oxidoreductase [Amycolatopsis mediterranei]